MRFAAAKHGTVLMGQRFCTVPVFAQTLEFRSRGSWAWGLSMAESGCAGTKTRLQRVWAFFKRPSSMSWSALVVAGGVAGILFWGGFNWAL